MFFFLAPLSPRSHRPRVPAQLLNVEAIIMGFNGALFKEAWRHMGAEAKANPDKNDFIAPTAMKMAVARDADGFRVMNSFLKAGLRRGPSAIIPPAFSFVCRITVRTAS